MAIQNPVGDVVNLLWPPRVRCWPHWTATHSFAAGTARSKDCAPFRPRGKHLGFPPFLELDLEQTLQIRGPSPRPSLHSALFCSSRRRRSGLGMA
eukprot:10534148-Prorocentrum_lima.AAC.1